MNKLNITFYRLDSNIDMWLEPNQGVLKVIYIL